MSQEARQKAPQPPQNLPKVLVIGASGATGKLLVQQLLNQDCQVTAVLRSTTALKHLENEKKLQLIEAGIWEMSEQQLAPLLENCQAVFSCLGHNLSFKGVFGKPRRLVADSVKKVCGVLLKRNCDQSNKTKFILMNTTGNSNRDIPEQPPLSQRCVVTLLRYVLPPHADNEDAANFLRTEIGQNHPKIEWVAVRPDGLIDESQVSDYDIEISPTSNVIFDAGTTSRINVAHFMAELFKDKELWQQWQGRMPVIYNRHPT